MGQPPQTPRRVDLPEYLSRQIGPIEGEALVHLRMGRYPQAEEMYRHELQLFVEAQGRERRSLHKGTPYHQIGVCLYLRNKFEDSLENFLMAYCEDTLSADVGQEDYQDRAPACVVLRDSFLIDLTFLRTIKNLSYERKQRAEIPEDPRDLLNEALEEHGANAENLLDLCQVTMEVLERRPLDPILSAWDRRVFIGGPFRNLARLRDIQENVIRLNYLPVLTDEVVGADQLVHHHSLMLLHTCRFAI